MYKFNQEVYKQLEGGPIGVIATNVAADLVMFTFINKYRHRLEKYNLLKEIVLQKVYIDDLNQAGRCLPVGTTYVAEKLYIPNQGLVGRSPTGQALPAWKMTEVEQEADRLNKQKTSREDRVRMSAAVYREIAQWVGE